VSAKELFDCRGRRRARGRGNQRFQELEKLSTGAGGEERGRVRYNISVFTVTQIEPDSEAAGVGLGVIVWYQGNPGRVGEADSNGGRVSLKVRCAGELLSFCGGSESTIEEDSLCVCCKRNTLVE